MLFWGGGKCFSVLAWEDNCDDDQRKEWETNKLIWSCSELGCTGCPLLSEAAQLCLIDVGAFLLVDMNGTCSLKN